MVRTITRFAAQRPLAVIVTWLAIVIAGFVVGTGVFDRLESDVGTVPGSESDRTAERLSQISPRPETVTAVITGLPDDGSGTPASVAAAVDDVRSLPGVADVSGPHRSPETGDALLIDVALEPREGQDAAAGAVAERLHEVDAGTVTVAGGPLSDEEFNSQAQEDVARAELISTPVVLVLLLIVFGGLLAAGLPLLIAAVGVGATFGILYLFSMVSEVSVYSIQITTMLAVGLAVDYALLMVSRFREERRTAPDIAAAVARTSATAGRTVLFSGLTVAIALTGLVVFPDPFLRSMGLAGAAVVLTDMAAALTLLPALLARFGHRISPAKPRKERGVFGRVARGVQRRPVLTLVATAGVLVTLAAPVLSLQISQGDPRMLPASTSTRQLWDELAIHYPDEARWTGDIHVAADAAADHPELQSLQASIAAMPGVADVEVVSLAPDLTVLSASPQGSGESAAAQDAVRTIRELPTSFDVAVTGDTATLVDYRAMLGERLPWAIAVVAIGTLLLLFAFTGSVLVPIKAVLTNMLSIGAALGVVVWVFQQGNLAGLLGTEGLGYLHLTVPVLVGAIAFGLSVDYEVFLMSRIRERWLAGDGPRVSVAEGLQRTGGIVTAAALVIGVVFAGFIFGGFAPIKAVGLGLVLAIAIDATIVRMLLVPATMTLLGRFNWWLPGPLQRIHARIALLGHVDEAAVVPLEGDRDGGGGAVPVLGHDEVRLTRPR